MENEDIKRVMSQLQKLQENYRKVLFLRTEIDEIPQRIEALEEEIRSLQVRKEKAQGALQQHKLDITRMEGEIKALQEQYSNKNVQTLQVKTNEQLWAIQKEMKYISEKISEIETKIIESMEDLDTLEVEVKSTSTDLEQKSNESRAKIDELKSNLKKYETDIVAAEDEREGIRTEIPAEYLRLIERIQTLRGGSSLAEARDGICQACHFRIRPQMLMELKMGKAIFQCFNCSRILFYPEDVPVENPAELSS